MKTRTYFIALLLLLSLPAQLEWRPTVGLSVPEPETIVIDSLFEKTVELIKKYETLHQPKDYPLVGYGHKVLKGESFSRTEPLDSVTADSLLRVDLLKNCAVFRSLGRDSLLLGTLSYNVGSTKILKSELYKRLKAGNRDIYQQYIQYHYYKQRPVKSIKNRRKEEFELLYNH